MDSDWPGRVNFALQGSYRGGKGRSPEGTLDGKLLESNLRGRRLRGELQTSLTDGDVRLGRAALHGDGFDATARGSLRKKLAFQADVGKLSGLFPGARGRLRAEGWVRWRDHILNGSLKARGEELSYNGLSAKALDLSAELSGTHPSLSLDAESRGLERGGITLETATVQAKGTREDHRIRFALQWPKGEVNGTGQGDYGSGAWKGRLLTLSGRDEGVGRWRLHQPAGLTFGPRRAALTPADLRSSAGERLRLAADLTWSPLRGSAQIEWDGLQLAHANGWLRETTLSGHSSGRLHLLWPDKGNPDLEGQLAASGKVSFRGKELDVKGAEAQVRWDGRGLRSSWDVHLGEKASLIGSLSSPLPAQPHFPGQGEARLRFENVDLSLLGPWLPRTDLSGKGSGSGQVRWSPGERLELQAKARLSGKISREGLVLEVRRASAAVEGGEKGVSATVETELVRGSFRGSFSSSVPLRLEAPDRGKLSLNWQDLDPGQLKAFLPPAVRVEGRLSGQLRGSLLPGRRLDLEGKTSLSGGRLQWRSETGRIGAEVKTADLALSWKKETLSGELTLALAEYGRIHGDFRLPLPARLPASMEEKGPVRGRLTGEMKEKGLLTALFPGLVRESRGRFEVDLGVGGTWSTPDYSGTLQIADGGAFLLSAGIKLEKVEAKGHFSGDRIEIESFKAVSGLGSLQGSAKGRLKDWKLESYRATIKGERFQAVHLPELEVEVSPDLTLEGSPQKLKVRGKVLIPNLLATGFKNRAPVQPSSDVVIVGAPKAQESALPGALDIKVQVVLGKHVLVKAMGLDARLEGDVTVRSTGSENITGQGQIKVAEGTYSAYGVKLKITRGTVLFAGGPVTRPTLDIQASRTIKKAAPVQTAKSAQTLSSEQEIIAGVRVTGTPQNPKVTLFSDPTMPDTDILAYIVLGHPLGADSGQASLLMLAAGGLLSKGESTVLQDKLKSQLGLSELSVESGGGNIQQSMVTIGKYLNPKLYIGIGQSLFSNTRELSLRYDLSKRWQLESKMGAQSGVDLFYKIEFE